MVGNQLNRKQYLLKRLLAVLIFVLGVVTMYFYQLPMLIASIWVRREFPHSHAHRIAELGRLDPYVALVTVLFAVIQIALLAWVYRAQLKRLNPLGIKRRRFRLESLFFIILMYGIVLAANIFAAQFGTPANQQSVLAEMHILPVTLFFLAGLLAPFIEELIFRGLFMNLFWQKDTRLNNVLAVVSSGLVFGLMHEPHLSVFLLLYTSLGIVLGWTYRYHRDLRYSIGLHMLINLPSALLLLLQAL